VDMQVEQGFGRLGARPVEDGGDTLQVAEDAYRVRSSRRFGGLSLKTTGCTVSQGQPGRRFQEGTGRHVVESQRLHRGEANMCRKRGRPINRNQVGPKCPQARWFTLKYLGALVELYSRPIDKMGQPPLSLTS
jgi:hypothetical protein